MSNDFVTLSCWNAPAGTLRTWATEIFSHAGCWWERKIRIPPSINRRKGAGESDGRRRQRRPNLLVVVGGRLSTQPQLLRLIWTAPVRERFSDSPGLRERVDHVAWSQPATDLLFPSVGYSIQSFNCIQVSVLCSHLHFAL